MSSSTQSLRARLRSPPVQGWVRLDGLPFTTDVAELFDADRVLYPVRYTERGETRSVSLLTGTDIGGFVGSNCEDDLHLLCFGRNGLTVPSEPRTAGKAIWVSNELFAPGSSGAPDAVCQRSQPPGTSGARALLATTSRSGASIPDPAALYVRPDGALVGSGEQLASGQLSSGIWQLGDGSYLQFDPGFSVWSGQFERADVGTVASTCNDWQSSTGFGVRGFGTTASASFRNSGVLDCSVPSYLYCIEP
jgi:hypothetical protein